MAASVHAESTIFAKVTVLWPPHQARAQSVTMRGAPRPIVRGRRGDPRVFYFYWSPGLRRAVTKRTDPVVSSAAALHHGLYVARCAGTQGAGDFDGRPALTTLSQRDGVGAALVRQRLP